MFCCHRAVTRGTGLAKRNTKYSNQSSNEHGTLQWMEHGRHFVLVCDKEIKFILQEMEKHLEEIKGSTQDC